MNWLVTGGCGFIGRRLVNAIIERGGEGVRVVDDLSTGTRADLASISDFREVATSDLGPIAGARQLVVADIRDADVALAAAEGADVIVHLAANTGVQPSIRDPRRDCMTNVVGTLNYLEAARSANVRRFVFASSGGTVIGDSTPPIHEDMVPRPKSPYGASKLAGEGYLSAYHGTFGIDTVALRFGNVYGPGSGHKSSVVANFINRALAGEPIEIYGDGLQTRDYIFIDDLIEAIVLASHVDGIGGEVFQIATSRETTVHEIADLTIDALSSAGITNVRRAQTEPLEGEIRRNYSDTSKAARMLGWRPRTELASGLERTVAWFLQAAAS